METHRSHLENGGREPLTLAAVPQFTPYLDPREETEAARAPIADAVVAHRDWIAGEVLAESFACDPLGDASDDAVRFDVDGGVTVVVTLPVAT